MDAVKEIKKIISENKAIIGTKAVLKGLKLGKIAKIFVTNNCPDSIKEDIDKYAKINKIDVVTIEMFNDELGILCKKSFSISVLGV